MASSLFDSLPYDILRQIIFYAYTNVVLLDEVHRAYESLLLPPMEASHVCQSWRHALIADRVMWTYIVFPNMKLEGIMELLHRSDSLTLNVCIRLANWWKIEDSPSTQSMLFTLFNHLPRFKLLRLRISSATYEISTPMQFLSYIAKPAPQLETFLFFHDDNDDLTSEPLLTTGTLFSGYAPKLKNMHSQLFLHFHERSSRILHNLTELSLILPYSFSLSADDILDLLASSPKLKFLYLHTDTDRNWPLILQHEATCNVILPNLQKLYIEGYHAHLIKFVLENVTFPPNVEWQFTACDTTSVNHMPNSLPQLLLGVPFTFLHLLFDREAKKAEMLLEEKGVSHDNETRRNTLVLRHKRMYDFANFWNASAMKSVNMSRVTRAVLEFEDSAQFAMAIFPSLLISLTHVESLTIRYNTTPSGRYFDPSLSFLLTLAVSIEQLANTQYPLNSSRECTSVLWRQSYPKGGLSHDWSLLCLHLRELIVDVPNKLTKSRREILRACSRRRYERGYPLKVVVCYHFKEVILV